MTRFDIPGKPVPQKRARVMRGGWSYDPSKKAKAYVAAFAWKAFKDSKGIVSKGDFSVRVGFFGANPLTDIDNLQKLILDALKGIFWVDDRQVIHIEAWKQPCSKGNERTVVEVEEINSLLSDGIKHEI